MSLQRTDPPARSVQQGRLVAQACPLNQIGRRSIVARDIRLLCRTPHCDWMSLPDWGDRMKPLQPREASPLWVWLTFALLGLVALAYLTGYLMVEEVVAFLK